MRLPRINTDDKPCRNSMRALAQARGMSINGWWPKANVWDPPQQALELGAEARGGSGTSCSQSSISPLGAW